MAERSRTATVSSLTVAVRDHVAGTLAKPLALSIRRECKGHQKCVASCLGCPGKVIEETSQDV
jgi:hypothetical protein